jgi:hypothetical protein
LKQERDLARRSVLESILAEQEAKLPPDDSLDRIRQWRMKATELHAIADQMKDSSAQDSLRRTARSYDRIADAAEARLSGGQSTPTKDAG